MIFGPCPVAEAEGAILAHSVALKGSRLRKGRVLNSTDVAALTEAGLTTVLDARLGPDDLPEDAAAARIVATLAPEPEALNLRRSAPFTGRANIFAEVPGVVTVDAEAVARSNAVDDAITLATLPDRTRVAARAMLATVKIIPYAVSAEAVDRALASIDGPILRVHPVVRRRADLILTEIPGMKRSLIEKGEKAVAARLEALGIAVASTQVVPHTFEDLTGAYGKVSADMALILTGSATSDVRDVGPQGLVDAGGRIDRFGMPVDPGNLLYIGSMGEVPVIGLPGCVRSPALNGADWVLERIACGLEVTSADIAAMGVGGLLKEIPIRPQPRSAPQPTGHRPKVAALVLAAGASRRMRGRDKLLEEVDGRPLLARTLDVVRSSSVDWMRVSLPGEPGPRHGIVEEAGIEAITVPDAAEGMAASLRRGIATLPEECDAAVVILADMPELTADHIDRLITAFDPAEGREICRATSATGTPGHPVLFGRRFFETLGKLTGDAGARTVLREASDFVVDVATEGEGAVTDLDTPEAWAAWRKSRREPA